MVRSSANPLEPWRMRLELRPARSPSLKVFKRVRDSLSAIAPAWTFSMSACYVIQAHPAYIPRGQARVR